MKYLLTFDKFITPKFITVLYWLLIVFHLIVGIGLMSSGIGGNPYHYRGGGMTFSGFLLGLFYIVVMAVLTRVFCELILVFFRINENLEANRNK